MEWRSEDPEDLIWLDAADLLRQVDQRAYFLWMGFGDGTAKCRPHHLRGARCVAQVDEVGTTTKPGRIISNVRAFFWEAGLVGLCLVSFWCGRCSKKGSVELPPTCVHHGFVIHTLFRAVKLLEYARPSASIIMLASCMCPSLV